MNPFTLILFGAILALNLPLLFRGPIESLIFDPGSVLAGEWWRLFTHPFIHVSLYHALLDAGAFAFLWQTRPTPHTARRDFILFLTCAAGSLAAALLVDQTLLQTQGFCGLSGIGHGLMAYQGLVWAKDRTGDRFTRNAGWLILLSVFAKSLFEVLSGGVFFGALHLGSIGTPAVACHLGGVIGGCLAGTVLTPIRANDRHRNLAGRTARLGCRKRMSC